jgi:hypothetical protein
LPSKGTTDRRKREGKCQRCELPHLPDSQYCETHRSQQREQNRHSQATRKARLRQLRAAFDTQDGECAVCQAGLFAPEDSDDVNQGLFDVGTKYLLCPVCSGVVRSAHRRHTQDILAALAEDVTEVLRDL